MTSRPTVLFLLVACGPGVADPAADGSAEEGGTTAASDGDDSAPDTGAPTPDLPVPSCSPVAEPVDPLVPGTCEGFDTLPPEAVTPLTVIVENATPQAVLLPCRSSGCNHAERRFDVTGQAFNRPSSTPPSNCSAEWPAAPCLVATGAIEDPGCLLCQTEHDHVILPPGAARVFAWEPLLLNFADLPPDCALEGAGAQCSLIDRELVGTLQFYTEAFACDGCECPGGLPSCDVPHAFELGALVASASADYEPGCDTVHLVLQ